jgi:hypothetical protein
VVAIVPTDEARDIKVAGVCCLYALFVGHLDMYALVCGLRIGVWGVDQEEMACAASIGNIVGGS